MLLGFYVSCELVKATFSSKSECRSDGCHRELEVYSCAADKEARQFRSPAGRAAVLRNGAGSASPASVWNGFAATGVKRLARWPSVSTLCSFFSFAVSPNSAIADEISAHRRWKLCIYLVANTRGGNDSRTSAQGRDGVKWG